MTDATESADREQAADTAGDPGPRAGSDGSVAADTDARAPDDHRPGRPPLLRFFEALGFRHHARVGVVAGVVLAVGLYGFFVAVPSVAPGVRDVAGGRTLRIVVSFGNS